MGDINFGANMKRIRTDRGLSMDDFCNEFNRRYSAKLNKSTISRYENGTQEPMISTAKKIAEFLEVSLEELLYGISQKETSLETIAAHALRDLTEEEIKAVITLAKHIKSEK